MRCLFHIALRSLAVVLSLVICLGISMTLSILLENQAAWAAAEPAHTAELAAAETLYREAGPQAALAEFEQLAGEYQATGQAAAEATARRFIGEIHWRLGAYEQAGVVLAQALELSRQGQFPALEAKVQNVLGLLHWDMGDYDSALAAFGAAGSIAAQLGDRRMQGAVLNNESLVRDELGEYRRSQQQYAEVLQLYHGQDFLRGEGDTLGNIGGVHLLLGEYREALDYYQRALAISETLNSVPSMSQDHGNIAMCQLGLGEVDRAIEHFDRAISLASQAGMAQDVAYWLRGKANAALRQGRYDQGLELHGRATEVYREIGSQTEAVEALLDLGHLYLALGDPVTAEQQFQASMQLARDIGLSRGITLNLLALGDIQSRRQASNEAEAFYMQAWQRSHESGELMLAAESLLRLSALHRTTGAVDQSEDEAQQALELARKTSMPYLQSEAELNLADISRAQRDSVNAVERYRSSLAALPGQPDPDLAWRIHYGYGLALADLGDSSGAIAELHKSIRYIEAVRERLEEQRFRAGYVQDKYQVYIDLVRLQMRSGQSEQAFATAERLRARSYLDLLEQDSEQQEQSNDAEAAALRERIRQLRRQLVDESSLPAPQQRQPAIQVFSTELLAAEQAYETLLEEQRRSRRGSSLAGTPTYADVRKVLPPGTALVEYVVANTDLLIFVLTRENLQALSAPMGRERLRSRVELLRDLIRKPTSDRWLRPAASLAKQLLQPLFEADALSEIQHLYLVPHGSLNYLPFALLPTAIDEQQLLLDRYTLAYLPTAAALLQNNAAGEFPDTLLAMAPQRSRLKHARAEASIVFDLFSADSRLLLGTAATETSFKAEAGAFGVLHLATHGYFNKLNPMLSGLELESDESNDGLLELHEILGLKLEAKLVTLSACQTGMGSGHFAEIPAGDDFVGLTRAFLYAGSESVMATLWEVDDASTAALMQQFYTELRGSAESTGAAAALAAAQLSLRNSKQYQHPYYWAPFLLMGHHRAAAELPLGA